VGLTVACVLRSGGHYRPGHVAGLRAQVEHFLPDARFVCLSDMQVDCERIQFESGWPGWWSKISLFDHFKGRTLYLDLDTVIVKDPDPLVTGAFTMIRNWVYPSLLCSGVMSWDGDYSHITRAFEPVAERVMAEYVTRNQWGDQAFIAEQAGNVHSFPPGEVASFRFQRLRQVSPPPKNARIVAFNGTHMPWHVGPPWARKWWASQRIAA
jgi:hypothetical protein